ncbi:hypothetical protein HAX54_022265 [Datura stramonium]|uniref:Uncharacterized protein n=1 Tax=Datura stramonium TaxID=4076 RepID=A0ABS8UW45_DATST|nr:hypothetical protein [Datura stramonium]
MKGDISCQDLKFEAQIWLYLVCTKLIPSKNTTHVSIEAEEVFDLAIKRDKDSPAIKKKKLIPGISASPTPEVSSNTQAPPLPPRNVSTMTRGLLKLAHMAYDHNAQLFKLAKIIPSMIQHAIKVVMKPVVEK